MCSGATAGLYDLQCLVGSALCAESPRRWSQQTMQILYECVW